MYNVKGYVDDHDGILCGLLVKMSNGPYGAEQHGIDKTALR